MFIQWFQSHCCIRPPYNDAMFRCVCVCRSVNKSRLIGSFSHKYKSTCNIKRASQSFVIRVTNNVSFLLFCFYFGFLLLGPRLVGINSHLMDWRGRVRQTSAYICCQVPDNELTINRIPTAPHPISHIHISQCHSKYGIYLMDTAHKSLIGKY